MQLLQLIELYLYICQVYDEHLAIHVQRHTKNDLAPVFTDQEVMTSYLFMIYYEKRRTVKEAHQCLKDHYLDCFPDLTGYKNYNERLNRLAPAFSTLLKLVVQKWDTSTAQYPLGKLLLTDSMPIVTCSGKRYGRVAPEMTDRGYNRTKGFHFWGVKLHAIARKVDGGLPIPEYLFLRPASQHDYKAQIEVLQELSANCVVGDKAFDSKDLEISFQSNGGKLLVGKKKSNAKISGQLKNSRVADHEMFNRAVSKIRQPIESLFAWFQETSHIQQASKVRSTRGLLKHIFGKLAAIVVGRLIKRNLI